MSLKQPKPLTLGFSLINDCGDTRDHRPKVRFNFAPGDLTHIAKKYANRDLNVVLPLKSALCDCIRYFVFGCVPQTFKDRQRSCSANSFDQGNTNASFAPNWNDDSVLRRITKLVQCEQEIIGSAERLITFPKPRNLFWESLAATVFATFEVGSSLGKGERGIVSGQFQQLNNSDGHEVQSRAEVLDGTNCVLCKANWERFIELELVAFVNAIGIRIYDASVWCSFVIEPRAPFKVTEALLSPTDSEPRIFERTCHSSYKRE